MGLTTATLCLSPFLDCHNTRIKNFAFCRQFGSSSFLSTKDVVYIQFSLFTVVEDKAKCQHLLSELAKYLLDPFVQASGWNYTSSPVVAFKRNNFLSSNRWLVRISVRCRGSWVQRPTYPVSVSANASFSQHYYRIYSIWGDKHSWLVVMGNFSWTQIRATLNWIRMLS